MISHVLPITEDEFTEIVRRSEGPHEFIPVALSVYGRAIFVKGDGSALWALKQLENIRNNT